MKYVYLFFLGWFCILPAVATENKNAVSKLKARTASIEWGAEAKGGSGAAANANNMKASSTEAATSTSVFIKSQPKTADEVISSDSTATSTSFYLDSPSATDSNKVTSSAASLPDPLPTGCAFAQSDMSLPLPTAAFDLDGFFIIQSRALWLPKNPTNPNSTIAGVDTDGDCVRDDIEIYIARKYGRKNQYQLRKYLYEYTAWMDAFLIQNIGHNEARYASNQKDEAGICIKNIVGENNVDDIVNDLFAKFHNTNARTIRYFENLPRISGWTTRESNSISCP